MQKYKISICKGIIIGMVLILLICLSVAINRSKPVEDQKVVVTQDGEPLELYELCVAEEYFENKQWVKKEYTTAEYSDEDIYHEYSVNLIYWNKETLIEIPDSLQLNYIDVFDNIRARKKTRKETIRFNTLKQFEQFLLETDRMGFYVSVGVTEKGQFVWSSLKHETRNMEYAFSMVHNGMFVSNGENQPYEQGIPLHEMDFSVYEQYEPDAFALPKIKSVDQFELTADLKYYRYKTDKEPVFVMKKGTTIYTDNSILKLTEFDGSGITIGSCFQLWPDYEYGWRYGYPFLPEDYQSMDQELFKEMYYVKTEEIEDALKAYALANGTMYGYRTFSSYKHSLIGYLDWLLFTNGAFDSGY